MKKLSFYLILRLTFLNTYAHLCRRLGRKEEAIKFQKEAVIHAGNKGEDITDYEKSLAEIADTN